LTDLPPRKANRVALSNISLGRQRDVIVERANEFKLTCLTNVLRAVL